MCLKNLALYGFDQYINRRYAVSESQVTIGESTIQFKYLIEAVLGQLKTRLISPKNFPSFIVAKTTLPSSLTTSTVPRLMKNICGSECMHST